jgi:serine O-acetyltransferase
MAYTPRPLKSPERIWYLSIAAQRRGHIRLARILKRVNGALYHNSLGIYASVGPHLRLEHHGFGVVVHSNVTIGRRVKIWQYVTLTVGDSPARLIIEDDVHIGAHAVIITPRHGTMRIGRAARIGAGAIVTNDVPAGATMVSPPAEAVMDRADRRVSVSERTASEDLH